METHVWGNAGSTEWEIYTADPKYIRRLTKLGYPVVAVDNFGTRFRVPLHAVRFGGLERRILSEKQKANIRKAHAAGKNQTGLFDKKAQPAHKNCDRDAKG